MPGLDELLKNPPGRIQAAPWGRGLPQDLMGASTTAAWGRNDRGGPAISILGDLSHCDTTFAIAQGTLILRLALPRRLLDST
jgi:hypothetical protein